VVPRRRHAFIGFVTPNVVRRLNPNEMTSFYYLHIISRKRPAGRSQSLLGERQRIMLYIIYGAFEKSRIVNDLYASHYI